MTKKAYSELTQRGRTRRQNEWAKELEENNLQQAFGRLTNDARVKELSNGHFQVVFTVAVNAKGEKAKYVTASRYVKADQEAYLAFLSSLPKGQLVQMTYKTNEKNYNDVWEIFKREVKAPAKAEA